MPKVTPTGGRFAITLSKKEKKQVHSLAPFLTQMQMADFFGVSRSHFQDLLKEDLELHGLYQSGRAKAILATAQRIQMRGKRNGKIGTTCDIFYLKTQAHWSEITRQEISGPGGGPIEIRQPVDLRAVSSEDLRQVVEEAKRHLAEAAATAGEKPNA
jgi:hypothetical protein